MRSGYRSCLEGNSRFDKLSRDFKNIPVLLFLLRENAVSKVWLDLEKNRTWLGLGKNNVLA